MCRIVVNEIRLLYLLILLFPFSAFAHAAQHHVHGYMQGFLHPLTGLDHSLAMLSVGLLASQNHKTPPSLFPLCFMIFMIIGGMIGFSNIALPWIELGILLSVFILGLMISLPVKLPNAIVLFCIFIFALCHGHAHGYEMTAGTNTWQYAGGFIIATGLLHLLGYCLGYWLMRQSKWWMPATGASILISSFWI